MKWKYAIQYGQVKPGWTFEQIEKDMAKYKAEVEKKGFKVVFWGHPYGVNEGLITVLDIEGHMDDYVSLNVPSPWLEGRTNFVMVH